MSASNKVASEIAKRYANESGDSQAALDPATILGFVNLVKDLITMFKDCKKTPSEAYTNIRSPNLGHRIVLRRIVKQELGRADFKANGEKVIQAFFESKDSITQNDVENLYSESKNW